MQFPDLTYESKAKNAAGHGPIDVVVVGLCVPVARHQVSKVEQERDKNSLETSA